MSKNRLFIKFTLYATKKTQRDRSKGMKNPFTASSGVPAGLLALGLLLALFPARAEGLRDGAPAGGNKVELVSDDASGTTIRLRYGPLVFQEIKTSHGIFSEPVLEDAYWVGEPGSPRLPASNFLLEVPFGAEVRVEVLRITMQEYSLAELGVAHPLYPAQPSALKRETEEPPPLLLSVDQYERDEFIRHELAGVEVLGVMRDRRIARLSVVPMEYNPVQQRIRMVSELEVSIRYDRSDRVLSDHIKASTYSPYFEGLSSKLLNPASHDPALKNYPDLLQQPVKMLIISHPDFQQTLRPFVEWQTQKGFAVTEAYTHVIGNTATAIRQYVRQQYQAGTPDDPAPTFVVLVGDPDKLPPSVPSGSASGKPSDLYYGSVDGDYFPEMYYGRLSARTPRELQNQIEKIIAYQQYAFTDPSFLNQATLIAGNDFTWGQAILQPTMKYASRNYFNASRGYEQVNTYLTSYEGLYDRSKVSVGFLNFSGHCTATTWSSPNLTVSGVHALGNNGQYPLVIGNCCQSGLFSQPESIAEAWMRAEKAGAVAYIGSAPDTHWFEDFYWSVGAFPIQGNNAGYVPSVSETSEGAVDALFANQYFPVAAIKMAGNLAITRAHLQGFESQSNILWYWQGYHTFGDPSTQIYLTEAVPNVVEHLPFVPAGADRFIVDAMPGSYIGISRNGVLHGAAFTGQDGRATVPIQPMPEGGTARIVVTRPQTIPYIQDVSVTSIEGPFVVVDQHQVNDPAGNNNQRADYGEVISLDVRLRNIGTDSVGPVTAWLESTDPFLSMVNGEHGVVFEGLGTTLAGSTAIVSKAFTMRVRENIPNQHRARLHMTLKGGADTWTSSLVLPAYAPVFSINKNYALSTSPGQAPLGRLDPGMDAWAGFSIANRGEARATSPRVRLAASSPYLGISQEEVTLPAMNPGGSSQAHFPISIHPSAPQGLRIPLQVVAQDGHVAVADTSLMIGQAPDVTMGHEDILSIHYPFYNLYRANRTQMLYLESEIGPGSKTISRLGFHILQTTTQQNRFPNFRIRIMPTGLNELPSGFVNMSEATEVFYAAQYQMPARTGWHFWDLSDFVYSGSGNLIIEVLWGMLPDWTSPHFRVASSPMQKRMVSYGYSDLVAVPSYNGSSDIRPNLVLGFRQPEPPRQQEAEFLIMNGDREPVPDIGLRIGSLMLTPDPAGRVATSLYPGVYTYRVVSNGDLLLKEGTFTLENQSKSIEVILSELFEVRFHVSDHFGNPIHDAQITLDGRQYDQGVYEIKNLLPGTFAYVVSREDFFDHHGTFTLQDESKDVFVSLDPENTSVKEPERRPGLSVRPNPARDMIRILLTLPGPDEAVLRLLNYQGMILVEEKLVPVGESSVLTMDLSGFAPGIYYLRAESGGWNHIKKIIVY